MSDTTLAAATDPRGMLDRPGAPLGGRANLQTPLLRSAAFSESSYQNFSSKTAAPVPLPCARGVAASWPPWRQSCHIRKHVADPPAQRLRRLVGSGEKLIGKRVVVSKVSICSPIHDSSVFAAPILSSGAR